MTENIENLVLAHLKRFRPGQERIVRRLEEVVNRIGHLEESVAGLRRDFAHSDENTAAMSVRLDLLRSDSTASKGAWNW